jgi:hypothetical protein
MRRNILSENQRSLPFLADALAHPINESVTPLKDSSIPDASDPAKIRSKHEMPGSASEFAVKSECYLEKTMADMSKIERNLTPRRAIRKHCIDCVGSVPETRDCQGDKLFGDPCLFYPYRMGRGRPSVRLIRKYCLQCMGGSAQLVRECPSSKCPFLPWRMGHRPKAKALKPSDKHLKALVAGRSMLKRGKEPHCSVNSHPESTKNHEEGKTIHAIPGGHDL